MRRREFLGLVGAAAAWPLGVSAQRAKQAIIGYLFTSAPDAAGQQGLIGSFREGMRDLGYVEGRDFTLELRFAGK